LIFQYYKLYRANVRTKVNALKAMQTKDESDQKYRLGLTEDYFLLMREYLSLLKERVDSTNHSIA
jgi:aminoglycoside phosphotransferase family enzyme